MMSVASGGPATQAKETIARVFITSAALAPECLSVVHGKHPAHIGCGGVEQGDEEQRQDGVEERELESPQEGRR